MFDESTSRHGICLFKNNLGQYTGLTLSNKMYFVHFQKRTYILKIQSALMLKSYSYGVENP